MVKTPKKRTRKKAKEPEGYDKFDVLARGLLAVPKAELNKEVQTYEQQKQRRKGR